MQDLLNRLRPLTRARARAQAQVASTAAAPRPLRRLVDGVLAGTGRAVWIEGGPGSGKTELLSRVATDAGARGCRLVEFTAIGPLPRFGPDLILARLGLDPTSDDLRRVLNSRAGLSAMFRRLSAGAPLVVAVDDLDRTDAVSVEFWGRLAVETRTLPLLLLATAQPEADRADLARVRDDVRSSPIRIACCQCGPADLSLRP